MTALHPDVTDDAALGGRLSLLQPRRGHRFGHDAVLLAAACAAAAGDRVVDLGAGVGLAGLSVALRVAGTSVVLVERDEKLAALAAENARRNGLGPRTDVLALDVMAPADAFAGAGLAPGTADWVVMNPPFNDPERQRASPERSRAEAHQAAPETLRDWLATAARLLTPHGRLALIWRAEGLGDVLAAVEPGFRDIRILPVHPWPAAAAIRVLVTARRGSRAPLTLLPGLALADADGRPAAAAEAVLRDLAALPL
ncbi:MAG: methyltransferase [Rhizobiales bacterium]|nr:methyltransferase [Hyphomicrobiales bacterium]